MKVRPGFMSGLLAVGGGLLTWAAASALEEYEVDKAASAASKAGETVAYNPGEPRRTF